MDLSGRTNPELRALHLEAWQAKDIALCARIAACLHERELAWADPEPLDIYDDSLEHRGVKTRGLVHLEGDWHRSFHCWVVLPERGTLLAQRRATAKRTYPGALDTTVAGHYRAGEGVREGCREADEELGLSLDPDALIPLGRAVDMARHGVLLDREVADVFLYAAHIGPDELHPDPAEVAAVVELDLEAALALFTGAAAQVPAWEYPAGGGDRLRVQVTSGAFTRHHDRYYARLALQARRIAAGEPPLLV